MRVAGEHFLYRSGSDYYRSQADRIVEYWLVEAHRETRSWTEHRDINEVMLGAAMLAGE